MIWENLSFFIERLKFLPVSESLTLGDGEGFCVSTGTEEENWIYYPHRVSSLEMVNEAVKFFTERGEVFMWPVYDGGEEVLESAGLIYAGDLTAMTLEAVYERVRTSVRIERTDDAQKWAETAWRGFGGETEPPENYYEFVRALSVDRENLSLYLAVNDGEAVGVFMLTNEPERTGVYYLAVLPEFRRRGIARSMMSGIVRLSAGKKVVLQSTPMGVNFYRAYGFEELFKIPVYSTTSDIF